MYILTHMSVLNASGGSLAARRAHRALLHTASRTPNDNPARHRGSSISVLSVARVLSSSLADSFQFLALGFDEAYPLWAISSVSSGGMDWTTHDVGQVWGI